MISRFTYRIGPRFFSEMGIVFYLLSLSLGLGLGLGIGLGLGLGLGIGLGLGLGLGLGKKQKIVRAVIATMTHEFLQEPQEPQEPRNPRNPRNLRVQGTYTRGWSGFKGLST